MSENDTSVWTYLRDDKGHPICAWCRTHVPEIGQIKWQGIPILGDIHCYTCFDCWHDAGSERRACHKKLWKAVS